MTEGNRPSPHPPHDLTTTHFFWVHTQGQNSSHGIWICLALEDAVKQLLKGGTHYALQDCYSTFLSVLSIVRLLNCCLFLQCTDASDKFAFIYYRHILWSTLSYLLAISTFSTNKYALECFASPYKWVVYLFPYWSFWIGCVCSVYELFVEHVQSNVLSHSLACH